MRLGDTLLGLLSLFTFSSGLGADYSAEIRAGYFYPTSSAMKEWCKNGGAEYEVELAAPLTGDIDVWLNVNFFQKKKDRDTTIRLYPLSLGIKHGFSICDVVIFYVGIGVSYTHLAVEHHSRQIWGGVGKAGFIYDLTDRLFVDLYVDYYSSTVSNFSHQHSQSLELGGLRTGLGFGTRF